MSGPYDDDDDDKSREETVLRAQYLIVSTCNACLRVPIISVSAATVVSLLTLYLPAGRYDLPKYSSKSGEIPGQKQMRARDSPNHPRRNVVIINIGDRGDDIDAGGTRRGLDRRDRNSRRFED